MGEQQDDSIIIENFSNFLSANGKRKTPERFKILDRVLEFKKQFTIEDLKIAMLDENFPVSQSTLYYTMDLLVDAKILHKIKTTDNAVAYERIEHVGFIHLNCEHCGKTKLVKDTGFMAYMNAPKDGLQRMNEGKARPIQNEWGARMRDPHRLPQMLFAVGRVACDDELGHPVTPFFIITANC